MRPDKANKLLKEVLKILEEKGMSISLARLTSEIVGLEAL